MTQQLPTSAPLDETITNTEAPSPQQQDKWVCVGVVMGAFGLDGTLRLKTYDTQPDWLDKTQYVWLEPKAAVKKTVFQLLPTQQSPAPGSNVYKAEIFKLTLQGPGRALLTLKGLEQPEAAAPWLLATVWLPFALLPKVKEENTFRTIELVGLQVRSHHTPDKIWGKVTALVSANRSAYDFLEIHISPTGETSMVPFSEHFIPVVNLEAGYIEIATLDSLFEELATPKEVVVKPTRKMRKLAAAQAEEATQQPG
jgi:ribosomal 30S subunit maturation factor RimM